MCVFVCFDIVRLHIFKTSFQKQTSFCMTGGCSLSLTGWVHCVKLAWMKDKAPICNKVVHVCTCAREKKCPWEQIKLFLEWWRNLTSFYSIYKSQHIQVARSPTNLKSGLHRQTLKKTKYLTLFKHLVIVTQKLHNQWLLTRRSLFFSLCAIANP